MLPFQTIYTTKNDLFGEFEKGRSSTLDSRRVLNKGAQSSGHHFPVSPSSGLSNHTKTRVPPPLGGRRKTRHWEEVGESRRRGREIESI